MKLDRLYIDDDGKLKTTAKGKKQAAPRNKDGLAREVEIIQNLVHRPPQAMRGGPLTDIKIPNV